MLLVGKQMKYIKPTLFILMAIATFFLIFIDTVLLKGVIGICLPNDFALFIAVILQIIVTWKYLGVIERNVRKVF